MGMGWDECMGWGRQGVGEKNTWVGMNVWDGGDHRLGIVTFAIRDLAFGFLDAMKMKAKR